MSTRVAAVDVGSDTTRLLIADVQGPDAIRTVARSSVSTKLSDGLYPSGRLADAARERVLAALAQFAEEVDRHACEARRAVLTSAVREARNGGRFAAELRRRFKIDARVINGLAEAELTFRGATLGRDLSGRVLVVDVGGGSTDLTVGLGGEDLFHASTHAGVVRMAERFLHGDPPAPADVAGLRAEARRLLDDAVPAAIRTGVAHGLLAAEGGTWRAGMATLGAEGAKAARTGVVGRAVLEDALGRMIGVTVDELRGTPGIHAARAPTLVAGAAIVLATMDAFGLDRLTIADGDLLEGLAMELAREAVPVG